MKSMRKLICILSTFIVVSSLSSCSTAYRVLQAQSHLPSERMAEEPRFDNKLAEQTLAETSGFALVLSGGGARGFAHIGALRALEEYALEPSIIVGSSAGAVIAAYWAQGYDSNQMMQRSESLDYSKLFVPVIPKLGQPYFKGELGLFSGQAIEKELAIDFPIPNSQDLKRRIGVVSTNLQTGKPQIWNAGDIPNAVRASAAIPGVFTPAKVGTQLYIDGQVSAPLPVLEARRLTRLPIIAVDVVYPPELTEVESMQGLLFQTLLISGDRVRKFEREQADIVVSPAINNLGQLTLADRHWVEKAGYEAMKKHIKEIARLATLSD